MKRDILKQACYPKPYGEQIRVDEKPIKGSKALITSGAVYEIAGDYNFKKPTEFDFSGWDNGFFIETLDGNVVNSFIISFDQQNRPIQFVDSVGHITTIVWESS